MQNTLKEFLFWLGIWLIYVCSLPLPDYGTIIRVKYMCHPMLILSQTSLCIYMEQWLLNLPNINIGWYGQVVEIFASSLSNIQGA
jgi:hypothetical protein